MPRLRLIHNFLWYLIYGHPHGQNSTDSSSTSQTAAAAANPGSSDPDNSPVDPQTADSTLPNLDVASSGDEEEELKDESIPRPPVSNLKGWRTSWANHCQWISSTPNRLFYQLITVSVISSLPLIVFADEDSWKRFVPPVRVHKEFGSGWAMIGDLLLCLPLSVFVQITQINYKVSKHCVMQEVTQSLPLSLSVAWSSGIISDSSVCLTGTGVCNK